MVLFLLNFKVPIKSYDVKWVSGEYKRQVKNLKQSLKEANFCDCICSFEFNIDSCITF